MKVPFKELEQGDKFRFDHAGSGTYIKLRKPVISYNDIKSLVEERWAKGFPYDGILSSLNPYTAVASSSGSLIPIPPDAVVIKVK